MFTSLCCPLLSRKRGDIKSHSSVCPSVRPSVCPSVCLSVGHKNFNLGLNFCTITDRALILGMCVSCDKTFPVVPCRDLVGDLWPTSSSNLLPSGGPQFSEFACLFHMPITYMSHICYNCGTDRIHAQWKWTSSGTKHNLWSHRFIMTSFPCHICPPQNASPAVILGLVC